MPHTPMPMPPFAPSDAQPAPLALVAFAHAHGTPHPSDEASSCWRRCALRSCHAAFGLGSLPREAITLATYDKQFTVQVTEQMLHFIDLLAKRQNTSRAEIARQAMREYLDLQEDLIGSRSRLGRTVITQLEAMQHQLVRQLNHMSTLLLAAVILQQIQRGDSGDRVMTQIVQLAGQIEQHLPGG